MSTVAVTPSPAPPTPEPTASQLLPGLPRSDATREAPARLIGGLVQRLAAAQPLPGPPALHAVGARVMMLEPMTRSEPVLAAWAEPGLLGGFLGKGHFHRAFAIDHLAASGERVPGRWMALIAGDDAHRPQPRDPGRLSQAITEHEHARTLSAVAPRLLPAYAGLAAITAVDATRGLSPALRYATVWERQDATFQDVVGQGGIAGGARIQERPFAAVDVARAMLLIGRAYRDVHAHDMVYTDPKPANLAFTLVSPFASEGARAGTARRAKAAAPAPAEAAPASTGSMIQSVVFIDAESLQPPGYARDPAQRPVAILTPPMAAEEILRGVALGGGQALKRAQANPANDVFHSAVISYGLVTGEIPQLALGKQRYQRRCEELRRHGGFDAREAEQVMIDEFRLTRLLDGYDHESQLLHRQVAAGRIPEALARVVADGLEGRITSLGDWERRTLALPGATP